MSLSDQASKAANFAGASDNRFAGTRRKWLRPSKRLKLFRWRWMELAGEARQGGGMRRRTILVGSSAVVLGGVLAAWWFYTGTPEYSLGQLAAATQAHERLGVEEYVDVHSVAVAAVDELVQKQIDRKSTRLNSSHGYISYAVFCLKKKNRYRYR